MHVLGAWVSKDKKKKLRFEQLVGFLQEHGIELIHINDKNFNILPQSGKTQTLLYKLADSNLSSSEQKTSETNLTRFLSTKSNVTLVDDLEVTQILSNRIETYALLASFENKLPENVLIPKCVLLKDNVEESLADLTSKYANIDPFPLVCKPLNSSSGGSAHVMSLLFNKNQLEQAKEVHGFGTHSIQRFTNHNSCLYKIYVIGCRVFVVTRPSVQNFSAECYPHEAIEFHTSDVSKAHSSSNLIGQKVECTLEDNIIARVVSVFVQHLKLSLFGIDVVIDSDTGQWIIIDVNHFPGFEDLYRCYSPEFVFEQFLALFKTICFGDITAHIYSIENYQITHLPK